MEQYERHCNNNGKALPRSCVAAASEDRLAEYISVYAIVTNYNGPLATAQARILVATHINVAK